MVEQVSDLGHIQRLVLEQFRLDPQGIHGVPHWRRVHRNAMRIYEADPTGIDPSVLALFAILHDSQRDDEYEDELHGVRGAEYARQLRDAGLLPWIDDEQFSQLSAAILDHPLGFPNRYNRTIGACWDADRLDLGRVGIRPDARYMSTEYGKTHCDEYWDEAWTVL